MIITGSGDCFVAGLREFLVCSCDFAERESKERKRVLNRSDDKIIAAYCSESNYDRPLAIAVGYTTIKANHDKIVYIVFSPDC